MSYILVGILILVFIGAFFGGGDATKPAKKARGRVNGATSSPPRSSGRPYALIERDGRYVESSKAEIDQRLAPLRAYVRERRPMIKKLEAAREKAEATGWIDELVVLEAKTLVAATENRVAEADALMEEITFETDAGWSSFDKLHSDLIDIQDEAESFLSSMADLSEDIENGDVIPEPLPPKKTRAGTKKPSVKGA